MLWRVTYGERFRQLREALRLEQPDLAERLFGDRERQPSVSAIEATAGRIPRPETVKKHAQALNCQVSELIGPVDDTWIDRARRGAFDQVQRRPQAKKRA